MPPLFYPEEVEKWGLRLLSFKEASSMFHCYVRHKSWPRGQYLFWSGLDEKDRILAIRFQNGSCTRYVPTEEELKSIEWHWDPPWELLADGRQKRGSRKRLWRMAEEKEEQYRQALKEAESLRRAEEQKARELEELHGLCPIERVHGRPTLDSLMGNLKKKKD